MYISFIKTKIIYTQTLELSILLRFTRLQDDLLFAPEDHLCKQEKTALRQLNPGLHVGSSVVSHYSQ